VDLLIIEEGAFIEDVMYRQSVNNAGRVLGRGVRDGGWMWGGVAGD
jgi:hypothetical protein